VTADVCTAVPPFFCFSCFSENGIAPSYSLVVRAFLTNRSDGAAFDANNSPECFTKQNLELIVRRLFEIKTEAQAFTSDKPGS
jgi:hypothetical protein